MNPHLPDRLAALLRDGDARDRSGQAFPLLTVDESGYPHTALLAADQLDVADDFLLASVAGDNTRRNLQRDRRATLLAIDGAAMHVLKLAVVTSLPATDRDGFALRVISHKVDSAGTALQPIRFIKSAALAAREQWDDDKRMLSKLRTSLPPDSG